MKNNDLLKDVLYYIGIREDKINKIYNDISECLSHEEINSMSRDNIKRIIIDIMLENNELYFNNINE